MQQTGNPCAGGSKAGGGDSGRSLTAALPNAAEKRVLSRRSHPQLLLGMCKLHGHDIYCQTSAACPLVQVQGFVQKAAAAALAATLFTGWTGLDAGLVPPAHANEEGNMSPSERRKMQMQKRKQLLSEA